MDAIQVIDTTYLVPLPTGRAIMVGAPPEALKVLVLWEYPFPSTVVLPPDPLFSDGINQASFEFLLYNHMFRMGGLRERLPFYLVCDPEQQERVEALARHMLRGPSDDEMAEWRTPASHRKQLILETTVVGGEVSTLRIDQMARVVPFKNGRAELPDGTVLVSRNGEVEIRCKGDSITVPRKAPRRAPLPLYFADVETPLVGPRFGIQIIGSASGFSGAEWGSCFIIWINGLALIVDGTPYLGDHLMRLGIEDDLILGYLITHNHEDHANAIGQLVNRRQVTVLTSGPVMAGLVSRLNAILDCPEDEVRKLFRWVPLQPGLNDYGKPLHWYGADIRTWYSVHTVPTLGVDVSMNGMHIRMPGDTMWGRQLEPLLEKKVIGPARFQFIQTTYDGADVIVADAGGGPVHPDPQEVSDLLKHDHNCRLMVTHIPEFAREFLPPAEPGTSINLIPREDRTPEEAMALFGSPVMRDMPERWLLALLHGGTVINPPEAPMEPDDGAYFVLSGRISVLDGETPKFSLQRGDLFHPTLVPQFKDPKLESTARWSRLLHIPDGLFHAFVADTGLSRPLLRLFQTRHWWQIVTHEQLGLDTLVALGQLARERGFRAGSKIVRQGEAANHFYIVTEGSVQVVRENGEPRIIGTFGPGFHFGEIALLGQEVRTATVQAGPEGTRVLELPARAFRRHLMDIPIARYRLYRLAAERKLELFRSKTPDQ